MLCGRSPADTYCTIDYDARVAGSSPRDLVIVSYEYFVAALDAALYAHETRDNARKSTALTRALAMLASLQLGIDPAHPLAPALTELYDAARRAVLDNVIDFDRAAMRRVRSDFAEIGAAFAAV